MENTRHKLNEAKFFLQQLEKSQLDHPTFDYFLSAFISAARSILWIMRHEYHEIEGWEIWYEAKQPSSEESLFLKKVNDIRVRSEKSRPLRTKTRLSFLVPQKYVTPELEQATQAMVGKEFMVTLTPKASESESIVSATEDGIRLTGTIEDVYRILEEFPDDNVLHICSQYYMLLEQVVEECEEHFSG